MSFFFSIILCSVFVALFDVITVFIAILAIAKVARVELRVGVVDYIFSVHRRGRIVARDFQECTVDLCLFGEGFVGRDAVELHKATWSQMPHFALVSVELLKSPIATVSALMKVRLETPRHSSLCKCT
jgi:hypothetical protein